MRVRCIDFCKQDIENNRFGFSLCQLRHQICVDLRIPGRAGSLTKSRCRFIVHVDNDDILQRWSSAGTADPKWQIVAESAERFSDRINESAQAEDACNTGCPHARAPDFSPSNGLDPTHEVALLGAIMP